MNDHCVVNYRSHEVEFVGTREECRQYILWHPGHPIDLARLEGDGSIQWVEHSA